MKFVSGDYRRCSWTIDRSEQDAQQIFVEAADMLKLRVLRRSQTDFVVLQTLSLLFFRKTSYEIPYRVGQMSALKTRFALDLRVTGHFNIPQLFFTTSERLFKKMSEAIES